MNKLINTLFWSFLLLTVMAVLVRIIMDRLYKTETSELQYGTKRVSIQYGRTEAGNDRIMGYRVPYDIVWRTGSGDATEIHFSESSTLQGRNIAAGKYSLWTIPAPETWTLILNSETGQYGTKYDSSRDVLRVKVPATSVDERAERLLLQVVPRGNGAAVLQIRWENVLVEAEIQ